MKRYSIKLPLIVTIFVCLLGLLNLALIGHKLNLFGSSDNSKPSSSVEQMGSSVCNSFYARIGDDNALMWFETNDMSEAVILTHLITQKRPITLTEAAKASTTFADILKLPEYSGSMEIRFKTEVSMFTGKTMCIS